MLACPVPMVAPLLPTPPDTVPEHIDLQSAIADHREALSRWASSVDSDGGDHVRLLTMVTEALRSGKLGPVSGALDNQGSLRGLGCGGAENGSQRGQPATTGALDMLRSLWSSSSSSNNTASSQSPTSSNSAPSSRSTSTSPVMVTRAEVSMSRAYSGWCATVKSLVDGLARRDRSRFVRAARIDADRALLRAKHGPKAGRWGTSMPQDVLTRIMGELTTDDARRCSHVCTAWNRAYNSDSTWVGLYVGRLCARPEAERRVLARAARMHPIDTDQQQQQQQQQQLAPIGTTSIEAVSTVDETPADNVVDHGRYPNRRPYEPRNRRRGLGGGVNATPINTMSWRTRVRETLRAVAAFNVDASSRDPSKAISRFVSLGLLDATAGPETLAEFLLDYAGISHASVSQYLCRRDPITADYFRAARDAFVAARIETATSALPDNCAPTDFLRATLSVVHLPRESNQIGMVLRSVSRVYHAHRTAPRRMFASAESCYVFLHAMLMVNTVAHNRSVHSWQVIPMDAVVSSMARLNDGADFERDAIEGMYREIKAREIRFSAGMYSRPFREASRAAATRTFTMNELRDGFLGGTIE